MASIRRDAANLHSLLAQLPLLGGSAEATVQHRRGSLGQVNAMSWQDDACIGLSTELGTIQVGGNRRQRGRHDPCRPPQITGDVDVGTDEAGDGTMGE